MSSFVGSETCEVLIRKDGKTIWINTDKGCVLRIQNIKNLIINDERKGEGI